MRHYDFIFSCGFSCGVTQALREADMQFASFPFDWTASQGFRRCARMIAADFAHWMDREDLELVDIRRGGINKHVYRNRRTGFGFVHDFSSYRTFDENFPRESAKYVRRIARFGECLGAAKTALAICVEWPNLPRISADELKETRNILSAKYPDVAFDLAYFHVKEGVRVPEISEVEPGITVGAIDYRTFEYGELNHEMDHAFLVDWLKANVSVTDPRSAEEKAKYAHDWAKQDRERWHGRNLLETFVNRTKFRQYRRLEKFLIGKGLVPRERPLWCLAPKPEER